MDVVHVCDALVSAVSPSPFQSPPSLDEARLEALGVSTARLDELRTQAVGIVEEAREMLGK
jgi:hypothetical protein